MKNARGTAAGGRRAGLAVTVLLLGGMGMGSGPAVAQDEPAAPPVVGTNGARGTVTVKARTPGLSGSGSQAAPGGGTSRSVCR